MKKFMKLYIAAGLILFISGSLQAQSIRSAEQARLPSNRPAPDKRVLDQRIAKLREEAKKQQALARQAEQERNQAAISRQPAADKKINPPAISNK